MSKHFSKLKFHYQKVLELYTVQGKSYKSISEELHIPYDSVYGIVQRLSADYPVEVIKAQKRLPTIFVIGDTQCKQGVDLEYMQWIGYYIAKKRPDVIVHIGDNWDLAALSSYDKGQLSAEGKRLNQDIEAGTKGMELIDAEIAKITGYFPRKVITFGNHEHRADRFVQENPELEGLIGTESLAATIPTWEVHPFLKPVEIHGIQFVHFVPNPMTGKPYGGTVQNILKNCGSSFVMGHKQVLDIAMRPTFDGKQQIAVIVGACYAHNEAYKGHTGNNHFRGCVMLTEVADGFALPSPVSLEYMQKVYEANNH